MTELIAKSPCDGLLPVAHGAAKLSQVNPGRLTTLLPYRGKDAALARALQEAHGMDAPAPGRTTGKAGARAIWFGQRAILLMGPEPAAGLARHAALTDQSDGWAVLRLEGTGAQDVLARLTPLDLRDGVFRRGHTARTDLAHMMGSLTRLGPQNWQLMVMRSFAATLVHEAGTAMKAVAARSWGV